MKKLFKNIIPYLIIIIVVILIRSFIITPVQVVGSSMSPTLTNGQVLILSKIDYRLNEISRYDIVVIDTEDSPLIKRVIGLPGEHISYHYGKLYINGEETEDKYAKITGNFDLKDLGYNKIPENYYFVIGDNRNDSVDSRIIGLINIKDIEGSANLRLWPLNKIKYVK